MSTRSNIILVTPDNKAHQFYHHFDGYLSGVGEELRCKLVYSLGMNTLIKDMSLYDLLVGEVAKDSDYEDEFKYEMYNHNRIHSDIEYLYVIKDANLYYVDEWDICNKLETYKDVVDYVCNDNHKLDLSKRAHD
jgi:phosphopantetheine adenylyltransferase